MNRGIAMMAGLLVLCGVAHAQNDDAMARARTHFEAGRALYSLHNYTDAIREFSAGYQLVPKPQFLVNIAQCYDRIADGSSDPGGQRDALEHSRDMYKKFLADAPPNDVLRVQVTAMLGDLDKRLASLPPAAPRKEEATPATTVTAPPPAAVVAQPQDTQPKKKSGIAKFWWLIPVAAVVVVGVSLGAYYGTRPTGPDCSTATFGCIDASKPGLIQY
jgi:tetratricopeptide (TPR) repeat protein